MKRTNIYLEPDKLRALKMLAVQSDSTVSDLVRTAVDAMIAKRLHLGAEEAFPDALRNEGSRRIEHALKAIDDGIATETPQSVLEADVAATVGEIRVVRTTARAAGEKKTKSA